MVKVVAFRDVVVVVVVVHKKPLRMSLDEIFEAHDGAKD